MNEETTKSFAVSKQMVHDSYLKVADKDGAAGIDKQTITMFEEDLSKNLYKIWNRMASGSYFPPAVHTVLIPKKQGGLRPLGIPTIGDRIAQGVVKDFLEPILEPLFHNSSYGYRPNRSAHQALEQCNHHCIQQPWVIDLDIKGFFDNIQHDLLLKMVAHHCQDKWVLLYIKRWLKAGIEQADGSIVSREKGTPQGGVISPLLANLYLHHAFDSWMNKHFASNAFERYADDIVVHCNSKEEAETLLQAITDRMKIFEIELHPDKTKLVYCKNYLRTEETHQHNAFTFLSYSFQPRSKPTKFGRNNKFMVFNAAICCKAKAFIKQQIRQTFNPKNTQVSLREVAIKMNPKIRGWLNYYSRFNPAIAQKVFLYLNELIRKWIKEKFKLKSKKSVIAKYQQYIQAYKHSFLHWKMGITY